MQCPRCKSARIQRGYKDTLALLRLAGVHELLCNNCGLEFKGFDPFGKVKRTPGSEKRSFRERRRSPRYRVHIPASICLVTRHPITGKAVYSEASRGHCETISKIGMALSFVGARMKEDEIAQPGRLLFVTLVLPTGAVDALITTVTHDRARSEEGTTKWLVGALITQMSETDTERLSAFLAKRAQGEPLVLGG
jgi:hypothetical protein